MRYWPLQICDALGGIRTRTGLPPEDFTYHYRFRGLPNISAQAVRGLDCLFAVPRVPKQFVFANLLSRKRVRRLLYSLYTLPRRVTASAWFGIVMLCLLQSLEFPELGSCYNRVSPTATHI